MLADGEASQGLPGAVPVICHPARVDWDFRIGDPAVSLRPSLRSGKAGRSTTGYLLASLRLARWLNKKTKWPMWTLLESVRPCLRFLKWLIHPRSVNERAAREKQILINFSLKSARR
jgi:hypothetical protein